MRLALSAAHMRTARRTGSSKRLVLGALALPVLLAACLGTGSDGAGDTASQLGDEVVSEDANDKIAFDYFVSKGLTDVQAAGIVGNLDQESGMSPTIAESGGGPGRGIAQWSVGGRWDTSHDDNVAWYAAQQGASMTSLQLQLDFIWYELTTFGYGYSTLTAATTVSAAEAAFQDDFEICGTCDASNRIAHAEAALADFSGSAPPPTGGSCTVAGVAGVCIATTTCAAMAGYVSTAGYCPGGATEECCTPKAGSGSSSSSSSTSSTTSSSSSSSSTSSSGAPPPSCNVDGTAGTCIDTSVCATKTGYTSTPGYCPGGSSEECCTPPPSCTVNGVSGICIDTSLCATLPGGTSTPGHCPGSASEECCTQ
jgi:Phage tail lysozyme